MSGRPGTRSIYLGLDLGTSGLKGVACDRTGRVLARAFAVYPTRRPSAGAAEQDPGDWLTAFESVVAELVATVGVPAGAMAGLSLSGMIPTLVLLDSAGQPVTRAITWEDGRAEVWAQDFRRRAGPERLYQLSGQWVDGRYLLPMFLRLAAEEPEVSRRASALCSAKDYIFSFLTGDLATDPSTAAGFGCFGLHAGGFLLELTDAAAAVARSDLPGLPNVLASRTLRPLGAGVAARLGLPARIPVCLGAADSVLAALGLGVRSPGDIAYVSGTSTVILAVTADRVLSAGRHHLVTPLADPGAYGIEMDLIATGSALDWLARLLGKAGSVADCLELAQTVAVEDAPVFLPYLGGGEQGALLDASLRGAVTGLELRHGAGHLARGLLNGVLRETRRCLDALDAAGVAAGVLKVTGGACADRRFRGDLADATGKPVLFPADGATDRSALGAALLLAEATGGAGDAGGWQPSAYGTEAGDRESGTGPDNFERIDPEPGRTALFESAFARHDAVLFSLHHSADVKGTADSSETFL